MYSLFVFLSKPDYVPYTQNLTPISRRILLQGQKGTAIYTEKLVKALAKHFNSKLIILDPSKHPALFGNNEEKEDTFEEETTLTPIDEFLRSEKRKKSNRNIFEKGDRVRFIGTESNRGPRFRETGRVIISVDDSKVRNIGVRWDKPGKIILFYTIFFYLSFSFYFGQLLEDTLWESTVKRVEVILLISVT